MFVTWVPELHLHLWWLATKNFVYLLLLAAIVVAGPLWVVWFPTLVDPTIATIPVFESLWWAIGAGAGLGVVLTCVARRRFFESLKPHADVHPCARLHAVVTNLARQANITAPIRVLAPRLTLAATIQSPAFIFTRLGAREHILCISEPLIQCLTPMEVQAVVGHELTHIKHSDMPLVYAFIAGEMSLFALLGGCVLLALFEIQQLTSSAYMLMFGGALLLIAAYNVLILAYTRVREHIADIGAIALIGYEHRHALASTLIKTARFVHGEDPSITEDPVSEMWLTHPHISSRARILRLTLKKDAGDEIVVIDLDTGKRPL